MSIYILIQRYKYNEDQRGMVKYMTTDIINALSNTIVGMIYAIYNQALNILKVLLDNQLNSPDAGYVGLVILKLLLFILIGFVILAIWRNVDEFIKSITGGEENNSTQKICRAIFASVILVLIINIPNIFTLAIISESALIAIIILLINWVTSNMSESR